jgi:hypothetical protein
MIEQRRADGSLRHLITLDSLRRDEIESLLLRSQHFARGRTAAQRQHAAGRHHS